MLNLNVLKIYYKYIHGILLSYFSTSRVITRGVIYGYDTMQRLYMMTSSNGNIFRVTGLLCGEFTGHRWSPRTKGSDAELWCFLWSAPALQLSIQWRRWWFETQSRSYESRTNVTRTHYADKTIRNDLPGLVNTTPFLIPEEIQTHSIHGFSSVVKKYY